MNYKVDIPELKSAMGRKEVNLKEFAAKMGVGRDTVSVVLKGKNPTYTVMCKMIDALELTPNESANIFFAPNFRNA